MKADMSWAQTPAQLVLARYNLPPRAKLHAYRDTAMKMAERIAELEAATPATATDDARERDARVCCDRCGKHRVPEVHTCTPTPESRVVAAARALVTDDPSDPWGYQKDAQYDALRDAVADLRALDGGTP